MAAENHLLQITISTFTRVVDVHTHGYSHFSQSPKKGDHVKGMIAEVSYLQGKIVMTRNEKSQVITQNTAFLVNPKQRKRKRALVQVDLGNSQDGLFEDGTIVHRCDSSVGAVCKVSVVQKDNEGRR